MNRAETLEQLARLCRREGAVPPAVHATGCAELDTVLPHGGWQSGTIVELMPAHTGIGELQLLMPALARISNTDRHIALIAPPYIPFAPALQQQGVRLERLLIVNAAKNADALWAAEQTLRCKSFGAVVAWPTAIKDRDVRRLQLASEAGRSVGFLYRAPAAAIDASPAAVRLKLQRDSRDHLQVEVLKCRGARSGFSLVIGGSRSAGGEQAHLHAADSSALIAQR
jgi:cell division inhibitor SulA/protein ImuA